MLKHRNRDIDKAIENLNDSRKKYFKLVEEIKTINIISQ